MAYEGSLIKTYVCKIPNIFSMPINPHRHTNAVILKFETTCMKIIGCKIRLSEKDIWSVLQFETRSGPGDESQTRVVWLHKFLRFGR